ncbi:MAG: putative DNA-binding domain-containing protein [Bdellovibrionales bacterium]
MQGNRLRKLQESFFNAIFKSDSSFLSDINPISDLSTTECLEIYSRGYLARLTEAIGETFEATWWVLGDDDFFLLCSDYIKSAPSNFYDLSDYGNGFPEFLAKQKQSVEIPFLVDLARFEMGFKEIFHKGNISAQATDWTHSTGNGDSFRLKISPSALLMESRFPVYTIWGSRAESVESLTSVDLSQAEHILMYKQKSQVFVRLLESDEFALMSALAQQKPLENALDCLIRACPETTPERVQKVFSTVAQLGVFSPLDP